VSDPNDTPEATQSKRNVIVTYATLEKLLTTTQRVDIKMDHLYEKMGEVRDDYMDHEARLRVLEKSEASASAEDLAPRVNALERTQASSTAGNGMATWLFQSLWPIAAVVISTLSYLNNPN
jgi:hypothetical protein